MKSIIDAINETFPKASKLDLSGDTKFEEIPGWDSMASVNFQIELESNLECDPLDFVISDDMTINSLKKELKDRGIAN